MSFLPIPSSLNETNPDSLPPVQSDEFLPGISRWITLGAGFLISSFGAAIALSTVLNYSVTVKGRAAIRPAGELPIVQAATEGIIKSIAVKENQVVRKGDAIAIIDDSQLQTKKSQLQSNIQQSQLQLTQIEAQINTLDSQIAAETSLMNRAIASAIADVRLQQKGYQDQVLTATAQVQEAQAAFDLAKDEMKRYQQLAKTGAIAELQVKEKEQGFIAATARLNRAKASLNPSDATVVIAKERIAQEKARGESTLAALQKEREHLQSAQVESHSQLSRDLKELEQISLELKKKFILAPTDGTILNLGLRNVGQVVQPGEAVAYIAPLNAPLLIKTRVNAQDITKVKPGQKVHMQVSACPYPDYGTLKGTVKTVAPDALPESNGANAPISPASYEVTIQPQTLFVGNEKHQCLLQPGMEGRADIVSRQETVLKFILRKARFVTDL